jgi:hypothetical protein
MKIWFLLALSASAFLVTGCKSDVDKCVDAYMKSTDTTEYLKKHPNDKSNLEAEFRSLCMRAAAGK